MGRKTEYDPETFPLLAEGYARKGLSDAQIAKNLGVSKATFYDYEKKYPDFLNAIKRGKRPVDIEVENAILKRALGFTYEEESTEVRVDEQGNATPAVVKRTKKLIPADMGAAIFWITNRKKEEWKNTKVSQLTGPDGGPIQTTEATVVMLPQKIQDAPENS